jgi:site-specific recombinase
LRDLLQRSAALLRAQSAALFGNLLAVTPMVFMLAISMFFIEGRPIMSGGKAYATLHSLSLFGVTPLFAAFTGVLLWLASVVAGFADNWFALRCLRDSIAHHRRVVHAIGPLRAERWAAWLERNVAGIAGNVALGVLLGMTPAMAQFFGMPLDVRHVTLSMASLTAAATSLGWQVLEMPQFWLAVAGVAAAGLLNVAVAFCCALGLAMRARDVPRRTRRLTYRAVLRNWALRPLEFLLPVALSRVSASEIEQVSEQAVVPEEEKIN